MAKKAKSKTKARAKAKPKVVIDGTDDFEPEANGHDGLPDHDDMTEWCLEVFYGPRQEVLQCDKMAEHKGNHVCFMPAMGMDGVIFEWPDGVWDEIEVKAESKSKFQGWTD